MLSTITSMMLNDDGSAYHLHALPEDIAPIVILVGDPMRVNVVAQHFDYIEVERSHREFVLKTGQLNNKRITVISTGIGSGNIDIVLNELDMLVNMDLKTRTTKKSLTQLKIIRLGTSGALQADIAVGSLVISKFAFDFDGLLKYYQHHYTEGENKLLDALKRHFSIYPVISNIYLAEGDAELIRLFKPLGRTGITFTALGFYGPQYRQLRAPVIKQNIIKMADEFIFNDQRILNFEMESAAILGLGRLLSHQCCSISVIVGNRITEEKSHDIEGVIASMIEKALEIISYI